MTSAEKDKIAKFAIERAKTCAITSGIIEHETRLIADSGLDLDLTMDLVDVMIDCAAVSNQNFVELIRECCRLVYPQNKEEHHIEGERADKAI